MIASLCVLLLVLPRVGVWANLRRWKAGRRRERFENALKHLLSCQHSGHPATIESLAGALMLSDSARAELIEQMNKAALIGLSGRELRLTPIGERWAVHVVRAHRLWERYLSDEAQLPLTSLHRAAERAEHQLSEDDVDRLDAHLGYPQRDPHGDPIPRKDGALHAAQAGTRLSDWPIDKPAQILAVEDKPELLFRQIVAAGLLPGKIVRVLERGPDSVAISDAERVTDLAPTISAGVIVAEPEDDSFAGDAQRLCDLPDRVDAEVVGIDPQCRGLIRRRLLDLGLTPGTRVRAELRNAFGDPRAFRVRGTLIALRREQTPMVWVKPVSEKRVVNG